MYRTSLEIMASVPLKQSDPDPRGKISTKIEEKNMFILPNKNYCKKRDYKKFPDRKILKK